MLAGISIRQFQEWRAFADLEPFDEARADLRSAQVVQALVNLELVRRRKRPTVKLEDCVLRFGGEPSKGPEKSPEAARREILRTMRILTAIYGSAPAPEGKKPPRPRKPPRALPRAPAADPSAPGPAAPQDASGTPQD